MLRSRLTISSEIHHRLEPTHPDNQSANRYHGSHPTCPLLAIPSEILTGVTAHLDPPSLLSLANVSSALYNHVKDDTTWRCAYASHYLGVGPNNDMYDEPSVILLRRSEPSWRDEYTTRFNLERKWKSARSSFISHVPVPSVISSIHLMSCQLVLSCCLQYGIVARSFPFSGKVYSGYFSAAANDTGLGEIGNPNQEFSPNASTCAVMSRGGSARVLWGFMDGSIAVILANKVMNPMRGTSKLMRCLFHEEHQGSVSDSVWNVDGMTALTGGFDGQVKLWLADPLECIWTSEVRLERALPDACLRVALTMSSQRGHIVAAFKSGQISFWTGFETERASSISSAQVSQIRIPCPIQEFKSDVSPGNLPTVACLHIDTSAEEATTILIAYKDHPYLYRIRIGNENDSAETTAFGDPSFGPVSTLSPYFATASGEGSFVIAGDSLGYVSIYDWRSIRVSQGSVRPIWRFEAHEDGGAVTSIAWNGAILMTGSSRGTMFAWDGSTFEQLRSFVYQPSRRARHHQPQEAEASDDSIKQIILDPSKDMFIAYARDTVLAWKADPVVTRVLRNSPSRSAKKNKNGYAKHIERLEMKEAIQESRRMVEQESEFHKRAFNREKEHRAQLEKLGLTEAESVEYVLMLSREEALGRGQTSQGHQAIEREEEEGVFDIDESFELGGQPNERKATSHRSSSPSTGSDQSIQLTPALSENQFPPIAVSPTPSSASETRSPSSGKSWSSVASASASGPASISSSFRPVGAGRHDIGHATSSMDDELRYALELSLAEAQSRGQCL